MSSKILSNEQGTVVLEITVEPEQIEPFLKQAAVRLSQKINIEGFRPGKAPYDVLKQRVGEPGLYDEASESIVSRTFAEAVKEHSLVTVGPPEITIEKLAPGNAMIYKAKTALLPKVISTNYFNIKAKKQAANITDQDVTKTINDLRKMRAKESAVDRPVAKGDKVHMNFRLFMDNVPIDGGQASDYPVIIGDNNLLPGFEENLIGMKANEEKTFNLTFPKNNPDKKLAGRQVECQAKVSQVMNVELPELNDEFAKALGTFRSLDELKQQVKENLTKEKTHELENAFEMAIIEEIIEKTKFDPLPELLRHVEQNRILHEMKDDITRRGLKWEDYLNHLKKSEDDLKKEMSPTAEKRIKSALLLKHIADQEKIEVPETELEAEAQARTEQASAQGIVPENFSSQDFKDSLKGHLRNKKVLEFLKKATDKV